jgi:hypothetical protein
MKLIPTAGKPSSIKAQDYVGSPVNIPSLKREEGAGRSPCPAGLPVTEGLPHGSIDKQRKFVQNLSIDPHLMGDPSCGFKGNGSAPRDFRIPFFLMGNHPSLLSVRHLRSYFYILAKGVWSNFEEN